MKTETSRRNNISNLQRIECVLMWAEEHRKTFAERFKNRLKISTEINAICKG